MPLILQGVLLSCQPRVQRAPAAGDRPKDPQCQLDIFDPKGRKDNKLRTVNAPLSVMKLYDNDSVLFKPIQVEIEEIFYNIEGNAGVSYSLIVEQK